MTSSVKFVAGRKKTRGELRLPQLHFIACDDWMKKIGKEAFCAWLQFFTWADRSDAAREVDAIPTSMGQIIKRLETNRKAYYQKVIRPLWNYGLIDLQEIELPENSKSGHNPVNIIVYEYPQNDPDRATKPLEQIRDYDTDYQTKTRSSARKGGRKRKKENAEPAQDPSFQEKLPQEEAAPSFPEKLPLVSQRNYPSFPEKHNNVLNTNNVLNINNEMNISQSVIENEAIKTTVEKSKKLTDRLTEIETTYLAIKNNPAYSDALFTLTLQKAAKAKISVPFGQYLLAAMLNNMGDQQQKKDKLPEWLERQQLQQGEEVVDNELSEEQKLAAQDLLRQLGELG